MTSPHRPAPAAPPVPAPAAHPAVIPAEHVPERRGTLAMLSHVKREGDGILPRLFRAVAFMGNVELDLTRARVGPGTSAIELRAVMGSISIMVPTDLRLELDVGPVLASVEVKREGESTVSPEAPLVRITGSAFMASVEVKVVDSDATGRAESLR
jgi:Cell wall-active antibiotics response 4TMS YvqF